MEAKRQKFDTRIVQGGKVYLLAEECACALGYESAEVFIEKNKSLIKETAKMPALLSEDDYNILLVENEEAFIRQWHIEVTRIDSLRIHTEDEMAIYPLKIMFAKELFEYKAKEKGCADIEEYIWKYDFPEEEKKKLQDILRSRNLSSRYLKECEKLSQHITEHKDELKDNGLKFQAYTEITDSRIALNSFVVGQNIMHEIYIEEDVDGYSVNEKGELCIREYDYETGDYREVNNGRSIKERDFSLFSALENMVWVLQNQRIEDAGVDLLQCNESGTHLSISCGVAFKLLNSNMSRDIIIVDGIVEVEEETQIAGITDDKVFARLR